MLNWKPVEFFQKGCNMIHFVKSEDDAAKSILDSVIIANHEDEVTCLANLGNMIVKGVV